MQQNTELISVIIPVYNAELYLRRCIDSVLQQTYKNLEIILVDDGSTDRSGEICDSYCKENKNIRVIHKENGGTASARNSGLESARGDFIGFVDSDDCVAEDMYQSLLKYMHADIDVTCCGRVCISPRKRYKSYCLNSVEVFSREEALEELVLLRKISSSVCTKLFRKSLFSDVRFPVGVICEDIPAVYDLFKRTRNVCHIGEGKYFNYYREDSKSNGDFYGKRIDYLLFKRDICIDIRRNYPQLAEQAEAGYMQAALYIVGNIQLSVNRDRYRYIEKRVRKMIRNMTIRNMKNPYLDKETKRRLIIKGYEKY